MKNMEKESQGKFPIVLIVGISLVVPALVAILFVSPQKLVLGGFVYSLPHIHAGINSATCLVLVLALVAIKLGKVELHRSFMLAGVLLGGLFLISYVLYHSSVDSVLYGDSNFDGVVDDAEKKLAGNRTLYLSILGSHVFLSLMALPLVLTALYHGLKGNVVKHKRIVKWAYPIWLYVSITGVIVYWMIRPYYF
jgi:putative membrane protein